MIQNTQGMIALLPTETSWCQIELPHLTVVYLGEISDLNPGLLNTLGKELLTVSKSLKPMTLKVLNLDVFGDEEPVDVFRLESSKDLMGLRSRLEEYDVSEHQFNPHSTIGPEGSFEGIKPLVLTFDRLLLAWGDTNLHFRLEGV